jgi:hypothetical protein
MLPLLLAALCGCGGEPPASPPESTDPERLRSLPYVGFAGPDTMREESGVVVYDPNRSWPGYTLYTVQALCRTELIDENGEVVRSWSHEPCGRWERGDLLSDGDLVVVGADPSGRDDPLIPDATRYLLRLDWDGRVLWKRHMPVHHDVTAIADDRLLVLAFRRRRIPSIDPRIDVRDDELALLDRDGIVLESLSFLESFDQGREVYALRPTRPSNLGVEPWIDLFHSNSVQWIDRTPPEDGHPEFRPGRVLVCLRHQNSVVLLDWEERKLVWAWGAEHLLGPHDAQLLDNGHLLVFDNGLGRGWSRVLELDPVAETIVWEYSAPEPSDFFTMSKGSNQRLPNGNTLIANSDSGVAFEVTPGNEIVWEYRNPHLDEQGRRAAIVRATRYDRSWLEGLRALPASAKPPETP